MAFKPLILQAVTVAALTAGTLTHSYNLTSSLNDQVGSVNLISGGGSVTAGGYVFTADQGLHNASGSNLLNDLNYTIFLRFEFDAQNATNYSKMVDLTNLVGGTAIGGGTSDPGFYVNAQQIVWFNNPATAGTPFTFGQFMDVVVTRDGGTGQVTGYINGAQQFTFTDSTPIATFQNNPGGIVYFFQDDNKSNGGEAASGTAKLIQIFDGALNSREVAALPAAVSTIPEPGTWTMMIAAAAILGRRLRRR